MPLIDIAGPSIEPVTADDVKISARIDHTEFDAHISGIIIPSLRRQAEARTNRRLISQTVELVLDAFPVADIDLQLPDVQSVVSVKYIDTAGVEQTLGSSAYSLDTTNHQGRAWLLPAYGTDWPDTLDTANAVRVRFIAGFGDAATDVPADIRLWMIAHAAQVLRVPEGITTGQLASLPYVDHLLDPWKNWSFS